MKPFDIAVLGAGSFGTAIATHLARLNHHVVLWGRDPKQIEQMAKSHQNDRYLPEISLPSNLSFSHSLVQTINNADHLIIATPSHAFKNLIEQIKTPVSEICWLAKGIEPKSYAFLHEVVTEAFPNCAFGILSGPSFAKEVANGMPTAVTLACNNSDYAIKLQQLFHSPTFRVYLSKDYIGVQLAGAMKNVLAIAVGVSDGLGFGANARAALITRGLNEMQNLGKAFNADEHTFMGLTGLGDLLLTATDDQSRNRRFGLALGKGLSSTEATKSIGQVVEGRYNADQVCALGQQKKISLPICTVVSQLINQKITPQLAVEQLLNRPPTYE